MKFFLYILFLLLFPFNLFSQSVFKQFKKLSRPERHWVLAHPCIAKKALYITKDVQRAVDSVKQSGNIGTDNNGGKLDAFKHAYWMASLAIKIGDKKALKLGKAHEKGNYLQYKKHRLEESILPDSVSSAMDLKNNEAGIYCIGKCRTLSKTSVQNRILAALTEGKLFIIKKNVQGNYLFCDGSIIPIKEWAGKWNIPKCLIVSNEQ